jgi:hypothetical protein
MPTSIPLKHSIGLQELQVLSSSVSQMKMVQNKLSDSKESLEHMTPENNGVCVERERELV